MKTGVEKLKKLVSIFEWDSIYINGKNYNLTEFDNIPYVDLDKIFTKYKDLMEGISDK